MDHEAFAKRVQETANRMPSSGRFGDNKAFIHSVWALGGFFAKGYTLDQFKKQLVESHQKRLLDLSRADMVEAMNPHHVKMSNTHHQGSTYNFVVLTDPAKKSSHQESKT